MPINDHYGIMNSISSHLEVNIIHFINGIEQTFHCNNPTKIIRLYENKIRDIYAVQNQSFLPSLNSLFDSANLSNLLSPYNIAIAMNENIIHENLLTSILYDRLSLYDKLKEHFPIYFIHLRTYLLI